MSQLSQERRDLARMLIDDELLALGAEPESARHKEILLRMES
jgi:hypothetical protein